MIDDGVLAKQRIAAVRPGESSCSRCGKRTRDMTGTCRACRDVMPDLRRVSLHQSAR